MLVTIAGCGALGCRVAARLIEAGIDVQAYQRKGKTFDALAEHGVRVVGALTGDVQHPLSAVSDNPAELAPSKLAIVLVKSYSTAEMAPLGRILGKDGAVLTMQNGLGNAEILADIFGPERVAAGVTTFGAFAVAPGVAGHGGDGTTTVGPWNAGTNLGWIGLVLQRANMEATWVDDPRPAIWRKLCLNAMINPVAALTGLRNGEVMDTPELMAHMRRLCTEAVTAANRAGVPLDLEEVWEANLAALRHTAGNKPSMRQDVEAGRRTEIDAISGAVLHYAEDENDFPYTRGMHALVTGRSKRA